MKLREVAMVLSTSAFMAIAGFQGHLNESKNISRAPASMIGPVVSEPLTEDDDEPAPNLELKQEEKLEEIVVTAKKIELPKVEEVEEEKEEVIAEVEEEKLEEIVVTAKKRELPIVEEVEEEKEEVRS
jgi:hypothetical protein